MTIKEFAKQKGVSTQAVYQRLTKSDIKVSQVVDKETRSISAEGEILLERLWQTDSSKKREAQNMLIESIKSDLSSALAQIATLESEKARLVSENQDLQSTINWMRELIMQQQETIKNAIVKRGFWARLLSGKTNNTGNM